MNTIYGFPVAKISGFPYGEWTAETPKDGGYYWYYSSSNQEPRIIKLYSIGDGEYLDELSDYVSFIRDDTSRFLGPLPVPETPKG